MNPGIYILSNMLKKNPGNPQKLTVTNLNDSLYTNTVRLRYLKKDWIV